MPFVSPEAMGMPAPLSKDEIRRLALKASENALRVSKEEARKMNQQLEALKRLEEQKMKDWENRVKK